MHQTIAIACSGPRAMVSLASNVAKSVWVASDKFVDGCTSSAPVVITTFQLNRLLKSTGVPEDRQVSEEELCLTSLAVVSTLLLYYLWFGKRHLNSRKALAEDLRFAQAKVHYLEEKLLLAECDLQDLDKRQQPQKQQVRIFMDGAYDLMHYGHMNAFRLARSLGTHLVVGVNSDESIAQCKGAPLLNDSERLTMVMGCKFVDEVVPACPYVMNRDYLDYVIKKHNIDYVVHGDDPCIVDGKDVYQAAKESGSFRTIPRTEGVSTTDIVGRMLLLTTDHHCTDVDTPTRKNSATRSASTRDLICNNNINENSIINSYNSVNNNNYFLAQHSKFLTTSRLLRLFSAGVKNPTKDDKIVYMDGAWDMFHPGHVAILKAAKAVSFSFFMLLCVPSRCSLTPLLDCCCTSQRADYLIVGVHGDAVVNHHRGMNLPLMNLHERVLSVLGCRHVDDVVIDAPYIVTSEVIASLNISEIIHGDRSDWFSLSDSYQMERKKRYAVPEEMGILKIIRSPSDFKFSHIVGRIQKNQKAFQAKFTKKMKQEQEYYSNKYQHQNISELSQESGLETSASDSANNTSEAASN